MTPLNLSGEIVAVVEGGGRRVPARPSSLVFTPGPAPPFPAERGWGGEVGGGQTWLEVQKCAVVRS